MLFKDMTQYEITRSIIVGDLTEQANRLEIMAELKNMYDNSTSPIRHPGSSDRVYAGRLEAFTPISFTAMIVDKIAGLLYSRDVERKLRSSVHNKALQEIYKGTDSAFMRLAKISSLCGYAALRLKRKWDGTMTFVTYGFSEVQPLFDPDDPHGNPLGLVFDVNTSALPRWAQDQVAQRPIYRFQEMITRHIRDEHGRIEEPGVYRAFVNDQEVTTPSQGLNPMGDYLGAVYWRGLDHPFDPRGKSDIIPLLDTLVALNELMTDGREVMIWGLHSPIITNAAGLLDWKYTPRSVFQIKAVAGDAAPFATRLNSATNSIADFKIFADLLLDVFHQSSRIPSVSVGSLVGLGQASSGRAFEIAMTPAKELIAEKENTCIPQELILMQEILAKMIYYGDVAGRTYRFQGIDMPDPMFINNLMKGATIVFSPIALPQENTAETRSTQVAGKIKSREQAVREIHPSWSQTEVDAELALIDAGTPEPIIPEPVVVEPLETEDPPEGPEMPLEEEEEE